MRYCYEQQSKDYSNQHGLMLENCVSSLILHRQFQLIYSFSSFVRGSQRLVKVHDILVLMRRSTRHDSTIISYLNL